MMQWASLAGLEALQRRQGRHAATRYAAADAHRVRDRRAEPAAPAARNSRNGGLAPRDRLPIGLDPVMNQRNAVNRAALYGLIGALLPVLVLAGGHYVDSFDSPIALLPILALHGVLSVPGALLWPLEGAATMLVSSVFWAIVGLAIGWRIGRKRAAQVGAS